MIGSQNHFKEFVIMEYVSAGYTYKSQGNVFNEITISSVNSIPKQSFCDLNQIFNSGARIVGIFDENGIIKGFGVIKKNGETGDYCYVRKCDYYLQDLFIYPEYRRRGLISEFLKYIMQNKGAYRLVVRSNNHSAIKCYEKLGFVASGKKYGIRIYKDLFFPKFSI